MMNSKTLVMNANAILNELTSHLQDYKQEMSPWELKEFTNRWQAFVGDLDTIPFDMVVYRIHDIVNHIPLLKREFMVTTSLGEITAVRFNPQEAIIMDVAAGKTTPDPVVVIANKVKDVQVAINEL